MPKFIDGILRHYHERNRQQLIWHKIKPWPSINAYQNIIANLDLPLYANTKHFMGTTTYPKLTTLYVFITHGTRWFLPPTPHTTFDDRFTNRKLDTSWTHQPTHTSLNTNFFIMLKVMKISTQLVYVTLI